MPEVLTLSEGHMLVLVLELEGRLGYIQLAVAVEACTAAAAWEPVAACTAVEVDTLRLVLPAGQQVHL
jgi:hypothetical protein